MQIVNMPPKQIKVAAYNPKSRTTNKGVKGLIEKIKDYGILVPLLIDKNKNLIDGHRRLACAILLKHVSVPTLEISAKIDKDIAFEMINRTQKKISNKDMLSIYLNGGKIPGDILRAAIELERVVGKVEFKKLAENNVSFRVLDSAKGVLKYCKLSDDEAFLKKTIVWLSHHNMAWRMRHAMVNRVNVGIITSAIKANRILKPTYA